MIVLTNFPQLSQLTQVTSDGRPSEDAQFECVPASIGMAMLYYQGKTQWDSEINPDRLKDAAYGEGWKNDGTAALSFVPFCKSLGFTLYPIDDTNPAILVQHAHEQVQQGRPVIITIPDVYVAASLHWSHVVVLYGELGTGLLAMDPYPLPGTSVGHTIHNSDAQWAALLEFNQIWVLTEVDMPVTIDITNPAIATHFKELNIHQWQCTDAGGPWQGKIIQYAMLSNYKTEGNAGLCGYDVLGRPMGNEIEIGTNDVIQFYEYGVRQWKASVVRPVALYDNGIGTDPAIRQLQAIIAQLKQAPVPPPLPTGVPPALIADVQAILDKAAAGKY